MHIQLAAGSLITAETSERRFTTGSLGSEYPFEVADGPPGSWRPGAVRQLMGYTAVQRPLARRRIQRLVSGR